MNIMFLMGSMHIDTNKSGYPMYLTEINGKMILEQQIEYMQKLNSCHFLFALKESEIKLFRSDSVIRQIVPDAEIVEIKQQTMGALCTAMLGIKTIDNDDELLLVGIDDFMDSDVAKVISEFRVKNADAGIVSFQSVHPRYSFVKMNATDEPLEFAEKNPISKNALVSFYYFKQGKTFIESAKQVIRKDSPVNGNFYISQALNEMILQQKKICVHKITTNQFHPLKTEQQMAEYLTELNDKKGSK
ncbi:MAG: glycosyltransferase family 2 protein [Rickettsiales bacterium]|nr:MAG: glycosyltransferase family 2 protein [Rickettsiales bacterium]